jgi:hypothetical protein
MVPSNVAFQRTHTPSILMCVCKISLTGSQIPVESTGFPFTVLEMWVM